MWNYGAAANPDSARLVGVSVVWMLALGWGLPGVWWGLCAGLATVASLLVAWVRFRGPAHAVPYWAQGDETHDGVQGSEGERDE